MEEQVGTKNVIETEGRANQGLPTWGSIMSPDTNLNTVAVVKRCWLTRT